MCDDLARLVDDAHAHGPLGPEDNARLHDLTLRFFAATNVILSPVAVLVHCFPLVRACVCVFASRVGTCFPQAEVCRFASHV